MLIDHQLFYPENIRFEDNGIGPLMCCFANRLGKVNKALYYYRVDNPNSQMGTVLGLAAVKDRMKSMLYLIDKSKELNLFDEYNVGIEYRFLELYYASNIQIFVRGNFKMTRDEMIEMRKNVETLFSNYMKNPYMKKYFPLRYKICCFCNGICPEMVFVYRLFFKIAYACFFEIRKIKKSIHR